MVVENGTGVANANTYVSREDFLAYALARGIEIADDDPADVLLTKAMDYLNGLTWKGQLAVAFQPLPWPRQFVFIGADEFPEHTVPPDVVSAQCVLAMQVNAGFDIAPTYDVSGGLVIDETVGPITTKFSDRFGAPTGGPNMPAVSALLRKWLDTSLSFRVVRA